MNRYFVLLDNILFFRIVRADYVTASVENSGFFNLCVTTDRDTATEWHETVAMFRAEKVIGIWKL